MLRSTVTRRLVDSDQIRFLIDEDLVPVVVAAQTPPAPKPVAPKAAPEQQPAPQQAAPPAVAPPKTQEQIEDEEEAAAEAAADAPTPPKPNNAENVLVPEQPEVAPAPAQQAADAPTPPKQNAGVLVPEQPEVQVVPPAVTPAPVEGDDDEDDDEIDEDEAAEDAEEAAGGEETPAEETPAEPVAPPPSEGLTGMALYEGVKNIIGADWAIPRDQVNAKPFMGSFSTIKSADDPLLANTGYCMTDNACGRFDAYANAGVPLSDLQCNKFCYVDANTKKFQQSQIYNMQNPPATFICCGWETCG